MRYPVRAVFRAFFAPAFQLSAAARFRPTGFVVCHERTLPTIDDKFVHDHFGKEFTLMPSSRRWSLTMNGDGIDDRSLRHAPRRIVGTRVASSNTVSDPTIRMVSATRR